jgi:hypothetical protein
MQIRDHLDERCKRDSQQQTRTNMKSRIAILRRSISDGEAQGGSAVSTAPT